MEFDSYLPEKQKKRKKRRRYFFILLACLVVYILLVGAAWFVLRSPWLRVKTVSVEGNSAVSSSTIVALLQSSVLRGHDLWKALLGFDNILAWPKELSAADLAFIPEIKSLTIEKGYRSATVSVNVEERKPYGIWCLREPQTDADGTQTDAEETRTVADETQTTTEGQQLSASSLPAEASAQAGPQLSASCWWFDEDGVLFKRALAAEGSLITTVDDYSQKNIGLGSSILPQEFISNAFSVFETLKSSGLNIEEIRLNNLTNEEVTVLTYDGPELYFSLRFSAANDLAVIRDLMSKPGFNNLDYIDFRVENRAYYK